MTKRRDSIMSAIFDLLYREYCRARLAEMRNQLLLRTESREIPEEIWDARHRAADGGRGSGDGQRDADRARPV
jgi:hypothetical protein